MATTCMIYATFPDQPAAEHIAQLLVSSHLAACCNILPGLHSVYWWEGAVQSAPEVALLVKTTDNLAPATMDAIQRAHPYENPAILQIPVVAGSADYLAWIARTVLPENMVR